VSQVIDRSSAAEPSRRERKKDATRERIAVAALELFSERGYEATTVDDIAARADVAKGTFFNYYPRKEAVLDALAERTITELQEVTRRLLASRAHSRRKLVTFVHEISRRHLRNPRLARVHVTRLMASRYDPTHGIAARIRSLVQSLIEQGQSAGELRRGIDAARASAVIQAMALGTLLAWFASDTPRFDLEEELQNRLALILDGLVTRPGGTR